MTRKPLSASAASLFDRLSPRNRYKPVWSPKAVRKEERQVELLKVGTDSALLEAHGPDKYEHADRTSGAHLDRRYRAGRSRRMANGSIAFSALLAIACLVINISVAIWISGNAYETGFPELYRGKRSTVDRYNTWTHLAINAVSTLLLSRSNFYMQCLMAPTRKEVDRAHKAGK